jgi:hypothetical protein
VCSPFNKHNTRKVEKNRFLTKNDLPEVSECFTCKKTKAIDNFSIYQRKDGSYRIFSYCFSCDSKRISKRKKELKKKSVKYKGGKCKICGYNKCMSALHFHHRDPLKKDIGIATYSKNSFDSLKKELDKCDLLCSNCHSEIHEKLFNNT